MSLTMIERDVPLPPQRMYPYVELQVGDSFEFNVRALHSVRTLVSKWGRKQSPPRRFVVRKMTADSYRCWRVE